MSKPPRRPRPVPGGPPTADLPAWAPGQVRRRAPPPAAQGTNQRRVGQYHRRNWNALGREETEGDYFVNVFRRTDQSQAIMMKGILKATCIIGLTYLLYLGLTISQLHSKQKDIDNLADKTIPIESIFLNDNGMLKEFTDRDTLAEFQRVSRKYSYFQDFSGHRSQAVIRSNQYSHNLHLFASNDYLVIKFPAYTEPECRYFVIPREESQIAASILHAMEIHKQ
ncbi:MAG: hypothetical protein U0798_03665 [Gemmataceae bacterium]